MELIEPPASVAELPRVVKPELKRFKATALAARLPV